MSVELRVISYDATGEEKARYCNTEDLITQQWAQFLYSNIFGIASTVITITGATVTNVVWGTLSALTIAAGIGTNAASVTDNKLGTVEGTTSGTCPGTLSALPSESSGVSGAFTITGTITNSTGSTVNYSELGLYMNDHSANVYLLTHDVFSAVPVSNTGTLSITYTITNS